MRDVYSKPVSLELDRELIQHYRVGSVRPDEIDPETFIAKYEILDDEKKTYYPFQLRIPKSAMPEGEYWKPLFDSVGTLYSRKEDKLTYGYKVMQLIIDEIFRQTKQAPPKKAVAEKAVEGDVTDKPGPKKEKAESATASVSTETE